MRLTLDQRKVVTAKPATHYRAQRNRKVRLVDATDGGLVKLVIGRRGQKRVCWKKPSLHWVASVRCPALPTMDVLTPAQYDEASFSGTSE